MMQENNLLNRNSTNDIQGVKLTYALVILISSKETENQLSYWGSTIEGSQIRKSNMFENRQICEERIGKNAILMNFHAIIPDIRSSGELENNLTTDYK